MKNYIYATLLLFSCSIQADNSAIQKMFNSMDAYRETVQKIGENPSVENQQQLEAAFKNYAINLMKTFPSICDKMSNPSWQEAIVFKDFFEKLKEVLMLFRHSNINLDLILTQSEIDSLNNAFTRAMHIIKRAEDEFKKTC